MITETTIKQAIFNWLTPILDIWNENRGEYGLDRVSGQVQLVWEKQNQPRVETPILMARLGNFSDTGRDYFSQPTIDGEGTIRQKQIGTRNFILSLQYFGSDALSQLLKVKSACERNTSLDILRTSGITAVDAGDVLDASMFVGTTSEDRAIMDIGMRTVAEIDLTGTQIPGIIERVKALGDVDSEEEIITIDVSTITAI